MMLVAERVTQHASELQVKAGGFASIERRPAYRSLRFARPNANQFPPLVHAPKLEAVGARDPGLDHVEATGQGGDCPGEVEEVNAAPILTLPYLSNIRHRSYVRITHVAIGDEGRRYMNLSMVSKNFIRLRSATRRSFEAGVGESYRRW
jgi:hypothetical protein